MTAEPRPADAAATPAAAPARRPVPEQRSAMLRRFNWIARILIRLAFRHVQVPPAAVSAKVDSQYFVIARSGPCWEHIMRTRNVGVYVPGELPSPDLELIVLLES